jgi:DNA repair protein RecN (Recombination protein N)
LLKHLYIKNYALIDELNIDFSDGLSILTGETGAGKSIVLGALSLILGQRADSSSLLDVTKKCIVEAVFDVERYALESVFEEVDVDYENNTVIRREINSNGKSRAFINDTPVNLNGLKDIVVHLIDIHSQHQTQELTTTIFQMKALDHYASLTPAVKHYFEAYLKYKRHCTELEKKEEQLKAATAENDFLTFQFEELEVLDLKAGEQEGLEAELKRLSNVEELKVLLQRAVLLLSEGEETILSMLKRAQDDISKASTYMEDLTNQCNRLQSSWIELSDVARELEGEQEKQLHDPNRIEEINNRLDALYNLQHKHQLPSVEELIVFKETLWAQLSGVMDLELELQALKKNIKSENEALKSLAAELSTKRKAAIPALANEINALLVNLGMKEAVFTIHQETTTSFTDYGTDSIRFLFSANKGVAPVELDRAASGGERSRLMLSIKSAIAKKVALPTIVFDEIDTGISGEIADKTGGIVRKIAEGTQVLCITHLPQMASKGKTHFLVYKDNSQLPPKTTIRRLEESERVNEIAKMLSGEQLTDQAIENAKVLLST